MDFVQQAIDERLTNFPQNLGLCKTSVQVVVIYVYMSSKSDQTLVTGTALGPPHYTATLSEPDLCACCPTTRKPTYDQMFPIPLSFVSINPYPVTGDDHFCSIYAWLIFSCVRTYFIQSNHERVKNRNI